MTELIFDSHLHLDPETDCEEFLRSSRQAGVGYFLLAAAKPTDISRYATIAQQKNGVFYTAGIHPLDCENITAQDIDTVRRELQQGNPVAVGEIGLDNHYNFTTTAQQEKTFAAMLELAAEFHKPVQIHCREAFTRCYQMVTDILPKGHKIIIHSFTDGPDQAEKWLELGAMLGYNGMVTFNKAQNIRENLKLTPLDRILLETDSPYLAPVPFRGKPNSSALLPFIARRIAQELNLDADFIVKTTTDNTKKILNLILPVLS